MKQDSRHLAAVSVGGFLLLIGGIVILTPILLNQTSEKYRDLIGAAAMGFGALLLAFGVPRRATDAVRGWLPWGSRGRTSSAISAVTDKETGP